MKPQRQDLTPLQSASISTFPCEIGGFLVEAMTAKIDSVIFAASLRGQKCLEIGSI
jgi:hypothetical protein